MTPELVLSDLERRIEALGDPRDLRSDNERHAYYLAFDALDRRRIALRDAVPELAKLEPQIAEITTWLIHLKGWRGEWQHELDALSALSALTHEQEQRGVDLTNAIRQVDSGVPYVNNNPMLSTLLRSKICNTYTPSWDGPRDPWAVGHGAIGESESKLERLTRKRDAFQSRLDAAMRETVTA